MTRKTCLAFLLALILTQAQAQDEVETVKKSTHYIGLQANQLIRQIFNFSNTNSLVNNPYFITWQVNSLKTGAGLNTGFGYTFSQSDDGDDFVDRTTSTKNLFFRFGFDKKSNLTQKWIVGWGLDIVIDNLKNSTKTEEKTQTKSKFESTNKTGGTGFGPRLNLIYRLNDKILVGTEANYYYKSTKQDRNEASTFTTIEFDPFTGQQREVRHTEKSETSQKFKNFQFNAPAVIFLILKF